MATKKTKNTKSIKSAPVLRDAAQYINSAGVKLPNADLIIEAEASGTVTSCRDAVTGTEYVGGGGDLSTAVLTVINNTYSAYVIMGTFTDENIYTAPSILVQNGESSHNLMLYKGNSQISIDASNSTIEASGNIEKFDEEQSFFTYQVSGDATITISSTSPV